MTRSVVVLLDPDHPYAGRFSEVCDRLWGVGTVCVYTDTSRWERAHAATWFARPRAVLAHYSAESGSLASAAEDLRRRHDVLAVIPHNELRVEPAVTLAEALGIAWADPNDVRRFRDKSALKQHLRSVPGGPRINATTAVRTLVDVRAAQSEGRYERFVLKPNDGMNNSQIGFFSSLSSDTEIDTYLAGVGGRLLVMEEFLDGDEYCVNGQVDELGHVTIVSVYRTHHIAANGRTNLAASFESVRHDSPIFASTAEYAASVVTAAGLRRSPFHMELIVDDAGPCLIEVGARLPGAGQAHDVATAHAGSVDAFELAAQHYLGLRAMHSQTPNWEAYDSLRLRTICGISDRTERIASVQGMEHVEAMPEFVRWVTRPSIGYRVRPTIDLASSPWLVTVSGSSHEHLDEIEGRIRHVLGWNGSGATRTGRVRQGYALLAKAGARAQSIPHMVRTRPASLAV